MKWLLRRAARSKQGLVDWTPLSRRPHLTSITAAGPFRIRPSVYTRPPPSPVPTAAVHATAPAHCNFDGTCLVVLCSTCRFLACRHLCLLSGARPDRDARPRHQWRDCHRRRPSPSHGGPPQRSPPAPTPCETRVPAHCRPVPRTSCSCLAAAAAALLLHILCDGE